MDWPGDGRIVVSGTALEVKTLGPRPGEAPTLVLLHEGLGCVALWRDFPERLAEATGCGVLVYSRLGYGQSDPAPLPFATDYMTREALNALPQVLDSLGVERCILVGHSDGATIAAIYAGSTTDMRVRGLVLMAPHFFTEAKGLAEIARAKEAFDSGRLRIGLQRYHRDAEATFRGWNEAWLSPEFADWKMAEVIDYLRVPILALQGRQDAYGTLAQIDELEERSYAPVDVCVLEDCGHVPFVDQPEATLSIVAAFVARLIRIESEQVATHLAI